MEKRFEIAEIKEVEIKLDKLKIPKVIVNKNKKLIISDKYMYQILRQFYLT